MARFNPLIISDCITVEVLLPSALGVGQQVPIRDIPELRNLNILGVSSVVSGQTSITPSGQPVITAADGLYLTLSSGSFSFIDTVPMSEFLALQYSRPAVFFKPRKVSFERSYITCMNDLQKSNSILLTLYYEAKR
jgi:hypothetical protein